MTLREGLAKVGFILASGVVAAALSACGETHDSNWIPTGPPDFKVAAVDLQQEYALNKSEANRKYVGRIIEVSGKVSLVADGLIKFEGPHAPGQVQATFHSSVAAGVTEAVQKGQAIVLWCEGGGSFGLVLLKNCIVR